MKITTFHTSFVCMALLCALGFISSSKNVLAQESPSVLYVPLIGITSVPKPLALPNGPGNVTYNYAVKNFLRENVLEDILVVDNKCGPIKFQNGDDNANSKLDYSETWRYTCTTKLLQTTQSVAIVTGHANKINATHRAYATVVVGAKDPAPLVSIINITKVAYPLSLPAGGGSITFTYKVNNPGEVPLSDVTVVDDKCRAISGKLGDTNSNNLLDLNEVWIYTCTTHLTETTTNIVSVSAFANGLEAVDEASITVKVNTLPIKVNASDTALSSPRFPNTGEESPSKNTGWKVLIGILIFFSVLLICTPKKKLAKFKKEFKPFLENKK